MISRDGAQMVADTTFPDSGLQVFDPNDGVGAPQLLCLSQSSNEGQHWNRRPAARTTTARSRSMRRSTRIRTRIFRRMGAMWSLRRTGVGGRRCTSVGLKFNH